MNHIIDCSQFSDIISINPEKLFDRINIGTAWAKNPKNNSHSKLISLSDKDVLLWRLWSKSWDKFLKIEKTQSTFKSKNVKYIFRTTGIGGTETCPHDPDQWMVKSQLQELCKTFGSNNIILYFGPIYLISSKRGLESTSASFETVAEIASSCGIKYCIYSYLPKTDNSLFTDIMGNTWQAISPSESMQSIIIEGIKKISQKYNIELYPKIVDTTLSYDIGADLEK